MFSFRRQIKGLNAKKQNHKTITKYIKYLAYQPPFCFFPLLAELRSGLTVINVLVDVFLQLLSFVKLKISPLLLFLKTN